jgi:hypothetical protein
MLALDAVEEQLQAIAWECERIRHGNVPGYMVHRSLEQIEARVVEIRRALTPAISDLHGFYRVADLVASRMTASLIDGALADKIGAALAERARAEAEERRHAERVRVALVALIAGEGDRAAAARLLPPWAATATAHPLALHLRSLGLPDDLATRAAELLAAPRSTLPDGQAPDGEVG